MVGTSTEMCAADQMFLEWMEDATVHAQLIHLNSNTAMVKLHYIEAMIHSLQQTLSIVSIQYLV